MARFVRCVSDAAAVASILLLPALLLRLEAVSTPLAALLLVGGLAAPWMALAQRHAQPPHPLLAAPLLVLGSLAIAAIAALALHFTPWGLRTLPLALVVALLTAPAALAARRGSRRRPDWDLRRGLPAHARLAPTRGWRALGAGALALLVVLAVVAATPSPGERYTILRVESSPGAPPLSEIAPLTNYTFHVVTQTLGERPASGATLTFEPAEGVTFLEGGPDLDLPRAEAARVPVKVQFAADGNWTVTVRLEGSALPEGRDTAWFHVEVW